MKIITFFFLHSMYKQFYNIHAPQKHITPPDICDYNGMFCISQLPPPAPPNQLVWLCLGKIWNSLIAICMSAHSQMLAALLLLKGRKSTN